MGHRQARRGRCEKARDLFGRVAGRHWVGEEPGTVTAMIGLCAGLPLAVRISAAQLAAQRCRFEASILRPPGGPGSGPGYGSVRPSTCASTRLSSAAGSPTSAADRQATCASGRTSTQPSSPTSRARAQSSYTSMYSRPGPMT
jgi:hypothetical protein